MKTFRDFIKLREFEETKVEGNLNVRALLAHLPGISDNEQFVSAMSKIIKNRTETLTREELLQLANAFVSLVRLDASNAQEVFQTLTGVKPVDKQEIASAPQPAPERTPATPAPAPEPQATAPAAARAPAKKAPPSPGGKFEDIPKPSEVRAAQAAKKKKA